MITYEQFKPLRLSASTQMWGAVRNLSTLR